MSSVAAATAPAVSRPVLNRKAGRLTIVTFALLLLVGVTYAAYSLLADISTAPTHSLTLLPFLLLGVALLIALGFEFVNGFHDTANAVATVIYTHSLPPHLAVVYSGTFNFLAAVFERRGRLRHHHAAAGEANSAGGDERRFCNGIRPADRGHHLESWHLVARPAALLLAHAHRLDHRRRRCQSLRHVRDGTSGVDWGQATKIGYSLLVSPLVGFVCAALLLLLLKALVKNHELYQAPRGNSSPPWWIRGLLILTCGGVSFAHGSNDGQKGMGLIMLILIGTVPMAYALNRAMPLAQMTPFVAMATTTQLSLEKYATVTSPADPRATLSSYVRAHAWNDAVVPALAAVTGNIAAQVRTRGSFARMPANSVTNVRNDMYLTSEAVRLFAQDPHAATFDAETQGNLAAFKKQIDAATKFIPLWVKVVVAIAPASAPWSAGSVSS